MSGSKEYDWSETFDNSHNIIRKLSELNHIKTTSQEDNTFQFIDLDEPSYVYYMPKQDVIILQYNRWADNDNLIYIGTV